MEPSISISPRSIYIETAVRGCQPIPSLSMAEILTFVGQPIDSIRPQRLLRYFAHKIPATDREHHLCPLNLFLKPQPHMPEKTRSIIVHRPREPFGFLFIELASNFNVMFFKQGVLVIDKKLLDEERYLISLVMLETATPSARI
jgi:hypothetical protein